MTRLATVFCNFHHGWVDERQVAAGSFCTTDGPGEDKNAEYFRACLPCAKRAIENGWIALDAEAYVQVARLKARPELTQPITFRIHTATLDRVRAYAREHGLKTDGEALRELLEAGLQGRQT